MAYIVVSFRGQEVGRWPLTRPLTIGRSAECDIVIRDILLSRRHCEIAPYRSGWIAVDLGSKNGTKVGKYRITRRGLADGDVLTLGKTAVRFAMGRLPQQYKPPAKRPADPFEALANTVSDFDPAAAEVFCRENNMPRPQPAPPVPAAFAKDDLYSLMTEIASSSWDSIYAEASQPKRPLPQLPGRASPERKSADRTSPERKSPSPFASGPVQHRSRLGFAEDLQVGATRRVRPASPLSTNGPASAVLPAPGLLAGAALEPNWLARLAAALTQPLAALRGWLDRRR